LHPLPVRSFLLLALFLTFSLAPLAAQESSSNPQRTHAPVTNGANIADMAPVVEVPGSPAVALRDVLSAACSQNEKDFTQFLTLRSRQSFSRLTPAARLALMKRFVLLNDPGKPTLAVNTEGRALLRCVTPAVTTETQIGRAQVHDNVAFLSMELHASLDSNGTNVRQITMGLVREDGQWKLLSLGLLLLDLPSLEVEWDSAEIDANESTVILGMEKISDAVESYRRSYTRLPESLATLGPPAQGAANAGAAGLLESDLAAGLKNGYVFHYVILGASASGAPAKFELAATPATYGRTGRRSFFRDSAGTFHAADRQGVIGSEGDPRLK